MEDKATRLFDEAVQKLKEANAELCRPEEDVVKFLVCNNAQNAISNYLKGFLIQNRKDFDQDETIGNLYEQCKSINKNFEEVHLSGFDCNAHKEESRFCNDTTKLSRCFDIADSLDTFLRREKILS
ncbi:MAG: hypothetical protein WBM53_02990 [Maribacter sp.]